MLDTVRVQRSGIDDWQALMQHVREEFQGAKFTESEYVRGQPWQGATWDDPAFGVMGAKSNKQGTYLWSEGSLGKWLHGDNKRLLNVQEVRDGLDGLMVGIEQRYGPALGPGDWRATRADFYYQQEVDSVPAVCVGLAEAMGDKGRLAKYLTSVEYKQSRERMVRWYGKGYESGDEQYGNVLRHEEQIRGHNNVGYFVDLESRSINSQEVRGYMNKRYEGWPEAGIEVSDVGGLIRDHKGPGMAAAAMVLLPALEGVARQHLSENTFYKYRKLATEYRRRKVNVDLRVPVGAWAED